MARLHAPETVRRVQRLALANGGSIRPFADGSPSRTVVWDVAGNCLSPVVVEMHGRASEGNLKMTNVTPTCNRPNFAELTVPCRKCANCLRRKAYHWRLRALAEYHSAQRTWLATFTVSPTSLVFLLSRARVRLGRAGTDYEALTEREQFLELEREGFAEVQKWLKRLRKNVPGSAIRYLLVTERHKSGLPHWHMLLHEGAKRLSYDRVLKGSWSLGFDSYKLVKGSQAAGYVTKYLSKSIEARVRASSRYGGAQPPLMPPLAEVNDGGT